MCGLSFWKKPRGALTATPNNARKALAFGRALCGSQL